MAKKKPNPLKKKKEVQVGPLWEWTSGVTQSAIEKFLGCREQFALSYIEGYTPRAFSTPLEFGTMFHSCLEKIGTDSPERIARTVTDSYYKARKATLTGDTDALSKAVTDICVIFPLYVEYYKERDAKLSWLKREQMFEAPYHFDKSFGFDNKSGGRVKVILRGKRDGEYRNALGKLALFETKTKSSIDDLAIQDGLRADLQTMLYLYSLRVEYGEEPTEILYNVVRRPQLIISKKKGETLDQYAKRLADDISSRPDWYFRYYEVTVSPGDIDCFLETTLDPVLLQMYQWWESIEDSPFERWGSPYHFRNLFALTTKYGKADLYNLMILGRRNEYYRRSSPFPELEESLQLEGV
jgi:hypothetical protein